MEEPAPVSPSPPAAKPMTLAQQWQFVGIVCFFWLAVFAAGGHTLLDEAGDGPPGLTVLLGIISGVGHGVWIGMDRKRRGRPVGVWRFVGILIGPLALILHLVLEYRFRGLLYILYAVAFYAAVGGAGILLAMILGPSS